ncbi:four helix bundle protein [Flavobacterium sp. KDG-16]|uniref:Four helix bundle protein n=1 Tax=Flavobacterium difficile TaxID=2709659 RepID=A0ABX0I222_9FLAO|nr:four helix bundle protein [Flavobacterium difficile]
MAKYNSFVEMEVYQKALQFGVKVYKLTLSNEKIAKDYGLKDQLQRAALSISNNIAEDLNVKQKRN